MNAKKQWRASVFNDVLDDLRKQRAKIEYAITALEALQNGDIPPTELVEGVLAGKKKSAASFGGLQFQDAIRLLFEHAPGPLSTAEISAALLEGGYVSDGENPRKVIAAQLHRSARKADSGIVKTGRGLWSTADNKRHHT